MAGEKRERLSAEQIEAKAHQVISHFAPEILQRPQPTPLRKFIEESSTQFGLLFDDTKDLPLTGCGNKILGMFRFRPRTILIDRSIANTPRATFVLGHEFGHFVLHRNLVLRKEDYTDNEMSDTEHDFVTGKKKLKNERDWIEWQANRFSSALILPSHTFTYALIEYQMMKEIKLNIGRVYVDESPTNLGLLCGITSFLARLFDVTSVGVEYRLAELGLLIDNRGESTRHISELLCID